MTVKLVIVLLIVASPFTSSAQSIDDSKGTRLITLGTKAGPVPGARRAQTSNILIVNGTNYVVDAGDGVARRLAKAGINVRDVGTVFLTHHHDDHTGGLGMLMSVAWDQNRTKPINVYGPPGTEALVKAAIEYYGISAEIRIADGGRSTPISKVFIGHDVLPGVVYEDANLKVTAVENSHYAGQAGGAWAGRFKSYSYRFETPDRVIVYTGDTGPSAAVTKLAKGADLLLSEVTSAEDRKLRMIKDGRWQAMTDAEREGIMRQDRTGHLTPDEVGKLAADAGVKTVVLTHLTTRAAPNVENYQPWADEVRKSFSGPVFVAKDLMRF